MKPPGLLALVLAVLALGFVLVALFVVVVVEEKNEEDERAPGASKVCTAGAYGPHPPPDKNNNTVA